MNQAVESVPQRDTVTISEYCFLIFTAIFSLLKASGFYEGQTIFNVGMVIAFCFVLLKIISTPMTWKEWLTVLLLLCMGGLVYLNTGEKSLLVTCAFLAGMKNVNSGRIMKTGLVCWETGYLILTFLSLIGLHPDIIFMHNKRGIGYIICHSLGYSHSNVLHINYLCICAMILYLARDRFSKKQKAALTGLLFTLDLYVFLYSVSYTGFLASIIFFTLYLYFTFRGNLSKTGKILTQLILPFCLLFSLAGPLVLQGRTFDLVNHALNTRYELTRYFLTEQPITLFGTRMTVPNYRYTLDCSYAYLFMRLGVIPFTFLMLLYLGTIHRLVSEQRMTELAIMLGLCIAGVTEPFLFNLSFKNVTLVFVGEYLYSLLNEPVRREGLLKSFSNYMSRKMLVSDYLLHLYSTILKEWRRHAGRWILIAFLIMGAAVGITRIIVKPVDTVYVNSTVNQQIDSEREHDYLTEEDVMRLKRKGNIIYGYHGIQEAMYPYTGRTAHIEYARILISSAVWTVGILCSILAVFIVCRYRRLR